MRTLFGLILGAALTIGAAYLYDSHNALAGASQDQALVNWDVVGRKWNVLNDRARVQWDHLSTRARTEWKKHIAA